jgi:hypothetical protein
MLILLTFVKINQSLLIFDSFSFLVQMVQAVFYDLSNFLVYYFLVITTFGFILMVIFADDSNFDSDVSAPFSFIIVSLRMVLGEGPINND